MCCGSDCEHELAYTGECSLSPQEIHLNCPLSPLRNAKSISFNSEMVKAILDGKKTETRRILKPANPQVAEQHGFKMGDGLWVNSYAEDYSPCRTIKDYSVTPCWMRKDEYIKNDARYKVDDVLYVQEKWTTGPYEVDLLSIANGTMPVYYKADYSKREQRDFFEDGFKASVNMPKEVARIFLKVTRVQIQRLQDMCVADCVREGVTWSNFPVGWTVNAKPAFIDLWNSITKVGELDKYGWEANPWVWVYNFERVNNN